MCLRFINSFLLVILFSIAAQIFIRVHCAVKHDGIWVYVDFLLLVLLPCCVRFSKQAIAYCFISQLCSVSFMLSWDNKLHVNCNKIVNLWSKASNTRNKTVVLLLQRLQCRWRCSAVCAESVYDRWAMMVYRTTFIQGLLRVHVYPAPSLSEQFSGRQRQNRCIRRDAVTLRRAAVVNQSSRWAELSCLSAAHSNMP